ncbi:MAG: peptide chain release factor 1 [Oenococcus sp.]|uniref:peptide chain release factor 1 n=1 Tax=Oenococcus sp. TaxID=1979414 RepID=UPI0039E86EBE
MDKFFAQIEKVVDRFDELNELLADPEVTADSNKYTKYAKELGEITPIAESYQQYKKNAQEIADDKKLLADKEMADLAKTELASLEPAQDKLAQELKLMMIPKDPNDDKNIIIEIRGAAGGDEANLFAGDLLNMYARYSQSQNWQFEIVDQTPGEAGGFKEVVANISGEKVYSKLKFESGAHRVQRVPITETQGRVHTSTATVGVMPEFEDIDSDDLIDPKDVREDVYRSSGAGGQHINKTSSAVRLVHLPTGIKVEMQEQRSQQQNRAKAWQILRSRVYDHFSQENRELYDQQRRTKIGNGDRSQRIRTYNFPQNRVTDHRINFTLNKLDRVMNGDLEEIIDALIIADQTKQLEEMI